MNICPVGIFLTPVLQTYHCPTLEREACWHVEAVFYLLEHVLSMIHWDYIWFFVNLYKFSKLLDTEQPFGYSTSPSASMAELQQLLDFLKSDPDTLKTVTLTSVFRFVTYAARLKDDIMLPQSAHHSPLIAPELLPASVLNFLASACGFSVATTERCWSVLKDLIWNSKDLAPEGTNFEACERVFLDHGHTFGLCKRVISLVPVSDLG